MNLNPHYELRNRHATLSPSSPQWLNYTEDKMKTVWLNMLAKERGTQLHDLAARLINFKIRLPKKKQTLNLYVNDGIKYDMTTEQPFYYSDNCFGTCDAFVFDDNEGFLRIHDLKTGTTPAKMEQLEVYAALFCLEYGVNPMEISTELRIYQNDDVIIEEVDPLVIDEHMGKIILFDNLIERLKMENR